MQRPRRIFASRGHWPPTVLKSTVGGTAIAWMSSCCLVSNGGTCMHIYIYIYILSVSLSVRSTAAKARRPPGLRSLSEQWSVPVIVSGVAFLLLLLPSACRAAPRCPPPLLRFQVANCFLSLLSVVTRAARRPVVITPPNPP